MTAKAKAILTLYKAGRVTKGRLQKAVEEEIITADEYFIITGEHLDPPATDEEPEMEEEQNSEENAEEEIVIE